MLKLSRWRERYIDRHVKNKGEGEKMIVCRAGYRNDGKEGGKQRMNEGGGGHGAQQCRSEGEIYRKHTEDERERGKDC